VTISVEKTIYRGDTPTFTFNIKQNGLVFNLTGYTAIFAAKVNADATTYLFTETCSISNPLTGVCTVTLTTADTATAGTYVAEIQLTKGTSVLTAIQFNLVIEADIYTGA
jgi:hypothetical protein